MIEVKASEVTVGDFYDFKDYSNSNTYSPILKTLMNDHFGQVITVSANDEKNVLLEVEFGHSFQTFAIPGDCILEEAVL